MTLSTDRRIQAAMLTAAQIRAGRALIAWTQADLAKASGVSEVTIRHVERDGSDARMSTLLAIKAAMEGAGVVFIECGANRDGGPGVRLQRGKLNRLPRS